MDAKQSDSRASKYKKGLLGLLALGVLASFATSGTLASFTATMNQPSGNITTGVLVLGNVTDTAAECFSSGPSITTNNTACANSIFSGPISSGKTQFHQLTIRNAGDINNAVLKLSASACVDAPQAVGTFTGGTAAACPALQFMVAEVASFTAGAAVTNCYFGANTASFAVGALNYTGCGFGTLPATTLDGTGGFDKIYTSTATGLNLGTLTTAGRKFMLGVLLPDADSSNAMMGRSMSTTFTWFAQ